MKRETAINLLKELTKVSHQMKTIDKDKEASGIDWSISLMMGACKSEGMEITNKDIKYV